MRTLITTVPFGEIDRAPRELLSEAGVDFDVNPTGRRLTENELTDLVAEYDVLVAGTEPISRLVLDNAPRLKLISRVGIGLDSVDLLEARKRNVSVSYTPDAPSPAVAELTIGLMLTLLRKISISNSQLHQGVWRRYFGKRLSESVVGVIGVGRIGKRVISLLKGFNCMEILVNDLAPSDLGGAAAECQWVEKERIYREADIITLHVPLTGETKNMIRGEHLEMMKSGALLINTARGGIINEDDLYMTMLKGHLGGAAIDVFKTEPYFGPLVEVDHCVLTAHMGSMTEDCRTRMEIEATEEVVRFISGQPLQNTVPEAEYEIQSGRLLLRGQEIQ